MSAIPDNLTKRYYSMSEVAKMFGVSKTLVRFWEEEFDYLKVTKTSSGVRLFTLENLRQFETIYRLVKEKGYTLNGAKKALKEDRKLFRHRDETIKSLRRIRDFLEDLKNSA